jgi:hypothetical protein
LRCKTSKVENWPLTVEPPQQQTHTLPHTHIVTHIHTHTHPHPHPHVCVTPCVCVGVTASVTVTCSTTHHRLLQVCLCQCGGRPADTHQQLPSSCRPGISLGIQKQDMQLWSMMGPARAS